MCDGRSGGIYVLLCTLAASLYNLVDTPIDRRIHCCVPRKVFRLLVAKSLVPRTLRPIDGHSNRAIEPILLGSRVKAWGFMSRSLVMACMHMLDISSVA